MTPIDQLAHLRDADLRELRYDAANPHTRTLHLLFRCAENPAADPFNWAGRQVAVTARGVALFQYFAMHAVAGFEQFEAIQPTVGEAAEALLGKLTTLGAAAPVRCTVIFQSGSRFELACRELVVEIAS
jgi:hypothetical protein